MDLENHEWARIGNGSKEGKKPSYIITSSWVAFSGGGVEIRRIRGGSRGV
jgi:hypothetical protein